jgi:uncharacterized membrane protein
MWYFYFLITFLIVFIGTIIIVMMLRAKVDAKKEKDMKKFWERMDYADGVINECLSKIESE